jgi:hypothetical protein
VKPEDERQDDNPGFARWMSFGLGAIWICEMSRITEERHTIRRSQVQELRAGSVRRLETLQRYLPASGGGPETDAGISLYLVDKKRC